jgi:hypothetical protein
MSEVPDQPPPVRSSAWSNIAVGLMLLVGILLLLPGACSLCYAVRMLAESGFQANGYVSLFLAMWAITLAIALGGIVLIRAGWRQI